LGRCLNQRFGLRVLAETPGPPAKDSLKTANFILERSALDENIRIFAGHPIPLCESGFLFVRRTMSLLDKFGRQITDLRISVTDRCNFRCVYCRSADPENYREHDQILSWKELEQLAKVFYELGIRKVRLTGGEPLVRGGAEEFVKY